MNMTVRRTVIATAAVSMALGVAACGKAGSSSSSSSASSSAKSGSTSSAGGKIGLLLPESSTTRYEQFDKPLIEKQISSLCPSCQVIYDNAQSSASTQNQQVSSMISQGVKVLIIDPVDNVGIKAALAQASAAGIKIVSYDRLSEGPVDAYVSYDNEKVGELQGATLLQELGAKAIPSTKIVEIDGDPSDPNAAQFKAGFLSAVKGKVDIAYDATGLWNTQTAATKMSAAISQLGAKNIAAVYSANDGMADGIEPVLQNNGIAGIPLSGQDAQISAIQRILAGTQSFTIFKDYAPEAAAAGTLAVDLLNGTSISSTASATQTSGSGQSVPSDILTPVVVNKANVKTAIFGTGGLYTAAQVCTGAFAADCTAAGIS